MSDLKETESQIEASQVNARQGGGADKGLEDVSQALKAAADGTRLRLLRLCAGDDLTVSELTRILGHSQPRVSRHLKVLVDAGLLDRHPEGAWVFYRVSDRGAQSALAKSVLGFVPEHDPLIRQDLQMLEDIKQQRRVDAAKYFDSVAADWDDMRSLHGRESDVEVLIKDLVANGAQKSVLDVGTGTGRLLEVCSPVVERGVGVDLSHQMLQVARSNLDAAGVKNCTVRHGDMYRLPFDNARFDVVIIHQVLHFADDPKTVLSEAVRVASPHGFVVVVDLASHTEEQFRDVHQHRRLGFSDEEMADWFVSAGLQNPKIHSVEGEPLTVRLWFAHHMEEGLA